MKKTGLICLAVVLALGAMGVGLAFWNETLTISGTAATGELDVEFTGSTCTDSDDEMANGGTVICELFNGSDTEPGTSPEDMSKATITIDNAYPCYTATCDIDIHNNGTIPAKVSVITTTNDIQLEVSIAGIAVDDVIDVNDTVTATVTVHVVEGGDNEAEELSSYTFDVDIDFTQSNAS